MEQPPPLWSGGDTIFSTTMGKMELILRIFRRRGKVISFFRVFFVSRPSRRELKKRGILKERVFGCDLAEHLQNVGEDVPVVLKACCGVIEKHGVVDGIYRLSGVASNIQKLRNAFDENRIPDMTEDRYLQDVHCITSLLKMYLRELPNPLLTYQLYEDFVDAVDSGESNLKILKLHDIVQRLPPPHYRTAEYLIRHLARIAEHGKRTGMHVQNLAIVWAPNLLRCKEHEGLANFDTSGSVLHSVGIQAMVTEYLIRYADIIFSPKMPPLLRKKHAGHGSPKKSSRPQSMAVSTPAARLAAIRDPNHLNQSGAAGPLPSQNEGGPPPGGTGQGHYVGGYRYLASGPGVDMAGKGGTERKLPDVGRLKVIDLNSNPMPRYHTVIDHHPGQKGRRSKFALFGSTSSHPGEAMGGAQNSKPGGSRTSKRGGSGSDESPSGSVRSGSIGGGSSQGQGSSWVASLRRGARGRANTAHAPGQGTDLIGSSGSGNNLIGSSTSGNNLIGSSASGGVRDSKRSNASSVSISANGAGGGSGEGVSGRRMAPPVPLSIPPSKRSKLRSVRSAESLLSADERIMSVGDRSSNRPTLPGTPQADDSADEHSSASNKAPPTFVTPPPPSVTASKHFKRHLPGQAEKHAHFQEQDIENHHRDEYRSSNRSQLHRASDRFGGRKGGHQPAPRLMPAGSTPVYALDASQKPLAFVNPCASSSLAPVMSSVGGPSVPQGGSSSKERNLLRNQELKPKACSLPPKRTPLLALDEDDLDLLDQDYQREVKGQQQQQGYDTGMVSSRGSSRGEPPQPPKRSDPKNYVQIETHHDSGGTAETSETSSPRDAVSTFRLGGGGPPSGTTTGVSPSSHHEDSEPNGNDDSFTEVRPRHHPSPIDPNCVVLDAESHRSDARREKGLSRSLDEYYLAQAGAAGSSLDDSCNSDRRPGSSRHQDWQVDAAASSGGMRYPGETADNETRFLEDQDNLVDPWVVRKTSVPLSRTLPANLYRESSAPPGAVCYETSLVGSAPQPPVVVSPGSVLRSPPMRSLSGSDNPDQLELAPDFGSAVIHAYEPPNANDNCRRFPTTANTSGFGGHRGQGEGSGGIRETDLDTYQETSRMYAGLDDENEDASDLESYDSSPQAPLKRNAYSVPALPVIDSPERYVFSSAADAGPNRTSYIHVDSGSEDDEDGHGGGYIDRFLKHYYAASSVADGHSGVGEHFVRDSYHDEMNHEPELHDEQQLRQLDKISETSGSSMYALEQTSVQQAMNALPESLIITNETVEENRDHENLKNFRPTSSNSLPGSGSGLLYKSSSSGHSSNNSNNVLSISIDDDDQIRQVSPKQSPSPASVGVISASPGVIVDEHSCDRAVDLHSNVRSMEHNPPSSDSSNILRIGISESGDVQDLQQSSSASSSIGPLSVSCTAANNVPDLTDYKTENVDEAKPETQDLSPFFPETYIPPPISPPMASPTAITFTAASDILQSLEATGDSSSSPKHTAGMRPPGGFEEEVAQKRKSTFQKAAPELRNSVYDNLEQPGGTAGGWKSATSSPMTPDKLFEPILEKDGSDESAAAHAPGPEVLDLQSSRISPRIRQNDLSPRSQLSNANRRSAVEFHHQHKNVASAELPETQQQVSPRRSASSVVASDRRSAPVIPSSNANASVTPTPSPRLGAAMEGSPAHSPRAVVLPAPADTVIAKVEPIVSVRSGEPVSARQARPIVGIAVDVSVKGQRSTVLTSSSSQHAAGGSYEYEQQPPVYLANSAPVSARESFGGGGAVMPKHSPDNHLSRSVYASLDQSSRGSTNQEDKQHAQRLAADQIDVDKLVGRWATEGPPVNPRAPLPFPEDDGLLDHHPPTTAATQIPHGDRGSGTIYSSYSGAKGSVPSVDTGGSISKGTTKKVNKIADKLAVFESGTSSSQSVVKTTVAAAGILSSSPPDTAGRPQTVTSLGNVVNISSESLRASYPQHSALASILPGAGPQSQRGPSVKRTASGFEAEIRPPVVSSKIASTNSNSPPFLAQQVKQSQHLTAPGPPAKVSGGPSSATPSTPAQTGAQPFKAKPVVSGGKYGSGTGSGPPGSGSNLVSATYPGSTEKLALLHHHHHGKKHRHGSTDGASLPANTSSSDDGGNNELANSPLFRKQLIKIEDNNVSEGTTEKSGPTGKLVKSQHHGSPPSGLASTATNVQLYDV